MSNINGETEILHSFLMHRLDRFFSFLFAACKLKVMVFFFIKCVEVHYKGIQDLSLYIYNKYYINIELIFPLLHLMDISLPIRRDKLDITLFFTRINQQPNNYFTADVAD